MVAKLLIVEDDLHSRVAMSAFFNELGYDLRSMSRGEDAMRVADVFQPDILIADWILAGEVDGVDLARYLQHRDSGLSIILITAHSQHAIRNASQGLSVATILKKPISLHQLNAVVEHLLTN